MLQVSMRTLSMQRSMNNELQLNFSFAATADGAEASWGIKRFWTPPAKNRSQVALVVGLRSATAPPPTPDGSFGRSSSRGSGIRGSRACFGGQKIHNSDFVRILRYTTNLAFETPGCHQHHGTVLPTRRVIRACVSVL